MATKLIGGMNVEGQAKMENRTIAPRGRVMSWLGVAIQASGGSGSPIRKRTGEQCNTLPAEVHSLAKAIGKGDQWRCMDRDQRKGPQMRPLKRPAWNVRSQTRHDAFVAWKIVSIPLVGKLHYCYTPRHAA